MRTKETKVTSVDDRLCICFPSEVIETRETTTDVGNAENPAVLEVDYLCLRVHLCARARVRRDAWASRRRCRARAHFLYWGCRD